MGIANHARKIKLAITIGFFLFIALYGFYRSSDLIFGVKIKNVQLDGSEAISGTVFRKNPIKISGKAKNAVNLTLNGREISIDLAGNFEETIALLPGYNIVSIKAVDKFGYVDEEDYKLIYLE
jgi:hypothetical protein